MNPFVFVVGCARSGTTLLQRMLDAHRDLAIIHATMWIPAFRRDRSLVTRDGTVRPRLLDAVANHRRFPQLGLSREDLEQLGDGGAPVSYPDFVARIFDRYGESRKKTHVGDQSPPYVRHLGILNDLWPAAKFVHILRDGRDVALSVLEWNSAERAPGRFSTWRHDPVGTTALWWKRKVRLGREAGSRLGPSLYREVRYESVVSDPAGQVRSMCSFLGSPFDPAMLRFHEGRMRTDPGLSAKEAWLPPTPGLRDWRTQMPPEDVERFEATGGDLLDELGYERAFPKPSAVAADRASTIRTVFSEDIRSRGGHLPERWEG